MAFCRMGQPDSDVYCYESCWGGFEIEVAGRRWNESDRAAGAAVKIFREVQEGTIDSAMEMIDVVTMEIPLSRNGFKTNVKTAGEAAAILQSLKDEGYRVPQDAIDELRWEARQVEGN